MYQKRLKTFVAKEFALKPSKYSVIKLYVFILIGIE